MSTKLVAGQCCCCGEEDSAPVCSPCARDLFDVDKLTKERDDLLQAVMRTRSSMLVI